MNDEDPHFGHYASKSLTGAVFLCLDRWIQRDEDARKTISTDLRSDAEIDRAIEDLKAELNEAGRRAKATLARLDK